jgi:hypothetical protein
MLFFLCPFGLTLVKIGQDWLYHLRSFWSQLGSCMNKLAVRKSSLLTPFQNHWKVNVKMLCFHEIKCSLVNCVFRPRSKVKCVQFICTPIWIFGAYVHLAIQRTISSFMVC